MGFTIEYDEFDLDKPTEGFASIPEAIEDIHQGKIVIVVDDEDRENEGDMVMAAELATPEAMVFFVKHGTGIVCISVKDEDLERQQLPLMMASKDNEEKLFTTFTVIVVDMTSNLPFILHGKSLLVVTGTVISLPLFWVSLAIWPLPA